MALRIACPKCGHEYQISDSNLGKKFRCRECQASVTATQKSGTTKPPSAPRRPSNKAPEYANDPGDYDDDVVDDIEDYEEPVQQRQKSGSRGRTSTGGGPSSAAVKKGMVIAAIVSVIGVVIAVLIPVFRPVFQFVGEVNDRLEQREAEKKAHDVALADAAANDQSPPDSGFAIRVPLLHQGSNASSKSWEFGVLHRIHVSVYRDEVKDAELAMLGTLPTAAEFESILKRDNNGFTPFVTEERTQLSQLSGVVAVETRKLDTYSRSGSTELARKRVVQSRTRRTRLGKYHWTVTIHGSPYENEITDAEFEQYFASFKVVGFARPPELDDALKTAAPGAPIAGKDLDRSVPFQTRRKAHQTKLTKRGPAPQKFEVETPPVGVRQVTYPSGSLQLNAWYAVPAGKEQAKNPVCVFFHGGFALGAGDFEACRPLLDAGFAVMTPMLRGENGNPGSFELLYGELDDAISAVRWVAQQPEVDSAKIFTFGHSIGGGVSALMSLADADVPVLLSGSCGGLYDRQVIQGWSDIAPFSTGDPIECNLRLLSGNQRDMKRRHVAYVGSGDTEISQVAKLAATEPDRSGLLEVVSISGDHFSSFQPSLNAFLNRMENEIKLSAVPGGSNTPLPSNFTPSTASSGGNQTDKKDEKDPYLTAPIRSTIPQNATVGLVRGFAMADLSKSWMAMAGDKGTVQVISTKDMDVFRSAKVDGGPEAVAFSGNGKYLAIATGAGKLRVYDIQQRSFALNESAPGGGITFIEPSDAENGFLIGTKSKSLFAFTAPQRKGDSVTIATVGQCGDRITGMRQVVPAKKLVAITSLDGTLRLFDAKARKFEREFPLKQGDLTCVAPTADGRRAAVGSRQGTFVVDLNTGAIDKKLYSQPSPTAVSCSALNDQGGYLVAIAHDLGRVILFNGETGNVDSACPAGFKGEVRFLEFSPDGKGLIAITSDEAKLHIWDLTKAPEARKQSGVGSGFSFPLPPRLPRVPGL